MSIIRLVMLCSVGAAVVMVAPLVYGADLKHYNDLEDGAQVQVCRDAVRAHPDVVKRLQATAERCVKQIQSELAVLAKRHPCLDGIGQAQIELTSADETGKVLCGLSFRKSTHWVETMSAILPRPDKNGCVLYVWVNNILAFRPPETSADHSDWFLVHEIEIHAAYLLRFAEENKDLDKTVRALIGQRFREMCDEMKQLQTAEDKATNIH